MILKTCSITEIPPNPSKNAQRIILVESNFAGTFETANTPLVSSIKPEINGRENSVEIPNNFSKGEKIVDKTSKILPFDNMEINTENKTTNPPIIIRVLLDSNIAVERISPRLENVANLFFWKSVVLEKELFVVKAIFSFLLNLESIPKIMAILKAERIWVINNKNPMEVFEKREIPTVPIMKRGPELFVKQSMRSASSLVQTSLLRKSATIFAPIG